VATVTPTFRTKADITEWAGASEVPLTDGEVERVDDLNYQSVTEEARTLIEQRATHLQTYHQRSAGKPISQQSTTQPNTTTTNSTTTAPTTSSATSVTTDSTTNTLSDQSTSTAPSTQSATKETQTSTETNPSDSPQEPDKGDEPLEDSPVPGFTILPAILAILFIAARRT
jgi:cobalamin biosynthesis Mg chelatase CobN